MGRSVAEADRRSGERKSRTAARLLLAAAALPLLWVGTRWQFEFERRAFATFGFDWVLWSWAVALVVLAGLSLGLAVRPPDRDSGYGWVRAFLLAFVPLLSLAHLPLVWVLRRHDVQLPGFLGRGLFLDDVGPQIAISLLVGLTLAACFTAGSKSGARGSDETR